VGLSPTHLRLEVAGSSLLNCLESPPPSLGIEEYLSLDPDMDGARAAQSLQFVLHGQAQARLQKISFFFTSNDILHTDLYVIRKKSETLVEVNQAN